MITKIIYDQNIALSNAEAIVNASNGIGYMGGKKCIKKQHRGVAESIQFVSKGAVEKLSRANCRQHSFFGYGPGNIFTTEAPNMDADYIIHAVTMRTPGSKAKLQTIKKLVLEIIKLSEDMHLSTVAIPLLGTGTGGLSEYKVFDIFQEHLVDCSVNFWIYMSKKNKADRCFQ